MSALLDIAPAISEVEVAGKKLTVHGITAADVVVLLARFPALRSLVTGSWDVETLAKDAPEAVGALIVAGLHAGKEEEAHAAALPIGAQLDILAAILAVTLPGGVGPFVAQVERFMGVGAAAVAVPVTKSHKQSKPSEVRPIRASG